MMNLPFTPEQALFAVGYSAVAVYVLWIFYLAVMNLQRAQDNGTLSKVAYTLGLPVLFVGIALDALVSIVIGTLLFLDPPREWLLTARLQRMQEQYPTQWRGKLATWICVNLLDTFDPSGKHCKCD